MAHGESLKSTWVLRFLTIAAIVEPLHIVMDFVGELFAILDCLTGPIVLDAPTGLSNDIIRMCEARVALGNIGHLLCENTKHLLDFPEVINLLAESRQIALDVAYVFVHTLQFKLRFHYLIAKAFKQHG
jgi:hypothetical protein